MNDNTLTATAPIQSDLSWAKGQRLLDQLFRYGSFGFAIVVLVVLSGVIYALVEGAWPALERFGWAFIVSESWNPVTEVFGARAPILGTLITSTIAMVIGIPVSLGIAIFITELCPPILKRPIGITIELLAGVPSIIYGIWGLFVLAPFLQAHVQPFLIATLGEIPGIGLFFEGPPYGIGMMNAGLVLAIMVLPYITSITRDVFETVPPLLKESAYGIGCTTWEVVRSVMIPYTRVGLVGGIMLGLGRALGETMAVTFVIGNAHRIKASLMAPATTISAALANEFTEATSDIYLSALVALGFILFVITFIVLVIAKVLIARVGRVQGA